MSCNNSNNDRVYGKKKLQSLSIRTEEWRNFLKGTNNCDIPLNIDNFKYCCLNKKGVLFENDIYQVGVVCTANSEGKSIQLMIYIGNKTKSEMADCAINLRQIGQIKGSNVSNMKDIIPPMSQIIPEVTLNDNHEKIVLEFSFRFYIFIINLFVFCDF